MDFWDFALERKLNATPWGDYLRAIKNGKTARPASVDGWRDVLSLMDRLRIDVDRNQVRQDWYKYIAHLKKLQPTEPDETPTLGP